MKVPTVVESFPDWLAEIIKKGDRGHARACALAQNSTAAAAESTFAPARSASEIRRVRRSPGPKLDCARRRPDVAHCPLNTSERYPDARCPRRIREQIQTTAHVRAARARENKRTFALCAWLRSVSYFTSAAIKPHWHIIYPVSHPEDAVAKRETHRLIFDNYSANWRSRHYLQIINYKWILIE